MAVDYSQGGQPLIVGLCAEYSGVETHGNKDRQSIGEGVANCLASPATSHALLLSLFYKNSHVSRRGVPQEYILCAISVRANSHTSEDLITLSSLNYI